MESDEQKAKNELELSAWNSWKDVCWVHGLGKRLEQGKPIIGNAEEEAVLEKKIAFAFSAKLRTFGNCFDKEELEIGGEGMRVDFAQEFDAALREYEQPESDGKVLVRDRRFSEIKARKPKCWKNVVWSAIAESEDPPLKVIRGKLLGKQGVINEIVEDWILRNFSARIRKEKNDLGKDVDVLRFDSGEDAIEEKSEETEREQMNLVQAMPDKISGKLAEALSPVMCCVLYAHAYNVMLYKEAEILEKLEIGKSTASTMLGKAADIVASMEDDIRFWIFEHPSQFNNWLKNRITLEKAGLLILSRIEEREKLERGNAI